MIGGLTGCSASMLAPSAAEKTLTGGGSSGSQRSEPGMLSPGGREEFWKL